MNYINNLGEFDSLADVWKEYPHGGKEGDYVVINGVNVTWNKYTANWGADTGMPDVNDEVNGDFLVKRDLRVGGEIINKGLKWLKDATIITKGYFATLNDLKKSYPTAQAGAKAYVGTNAPYKIYTWNAKDNAWLDTGEYLDDSNRNKGYYKDVQRLKESHPVATEGSKAYVGENFPYAIYLWDTTTSTWQNSGVTGGEEYIQLNDYYTKEETDAKVAELESVLMPTPKVGAIQNGVWNATNALAHLVIPIEESARVVVDAKKGFYSFFAENKILNNGDIPAYALGYSDRVYFSNVLDIQAPTNAKYLYLNYSEDEDYVIKSILVNEIERYTTLNNVVEEAVREMTSLKAHLSDKGILYTFVGGGIGASDGNDANNSDYIRTGYIPVEEGDKFNVDLKLGSSGWGAVACYDSSKNYISNLSLKGSQNTTFEVPSGVAFVRFSSQVDYESTKVQSVGIKEKDIDTKIKVFAGDIPFDEIGSWNYADNTDSPHSSFVRTGYISVKEGDVVNCRLSAATSAWGAIGMYDSEKNYLKELSYNAIEMHPTIIKLIIPNGVAFVRFSSAKNFDYYATINQILRDNLILSTCDKIVNPYSLMKYPHILGKRGCLAIQMDLGNLDDSYSGHKSMLKVLRDFGLMSMDYAINITALDHADVSWLNVAQMEGCEIIYHNRINSPSDFSSTSTLTEEEAKAGVTDERRRMTQQGFTTFGYVANVGTVAERFKPMLNNLFAWGEYSSAMILTSGAETTKEQYLSTQRIVRTSFDMRYDAHSAEKEMEMISKGKAWIDSICANQSMGVMYCHFYNTFVDDYHLYESVLKAMCEYIVEKINNGELYYGATTECLNYLLSN